MRNTRRINEGKKFGWKTYCSPFCLGASRKKHKKLICENPKCGKNFSKKLSQISLRNYCSRSCAVTINNSRFPKLPPAVRHYCIVCGKACHAGKEFCSPKCKHANQVIGKEKLLQLLKQFFKDKQRIPLKREFGHYHATRYSFGTWNNAIKAAGFEPNPVMFANKHVAKDGHKCDSLAERIIDDWLFRRKIKHDRAVSYPGNHGFTADFKVEDYWIEFFGLSGELKEYDRIKKKKLQLAKIYNLKLIEIYPQHLFPKGRLDEVFTVLLN